MNRDLKEQTMTETQPEELPSQRSPIQIEISPDLEKKLVAIIEDDFRTFKDVRDKRDYGKNDKGKSFDFSDWFKTLQDLYNGERIPKTIPWKFCSNRSLRIAASILDLLHSRMYRAVVNQDLLRWKALNYFDHPKVEKIEKLMFWWIWVHNRMRAFFDRWIKCELGYGDSIVESTWKMIPVETNQMDSQAIIDETGQPMMNPDGTPARLQGYKIKFLESSESRIYLRDSFYLQENSTEIERETVIFEEKISYRDLEEGEKKGTFVNISDKLRPLIPVTGIEGVEGDAEYEMLKDVKLRNESVEILKTYIHFDANEDRFAEDLRVYIVPKYHLFIGGMRTLFLTKSGRRALTYTKLEDRIKNVEENWGIGVLEKVRELADEIDAIFNQMTDGNTLSILMPGFYDPGGDIDAPSLNISPNKWTPVSNPQQSIYIPPINVPTEKLINAIRLVIEFIERLTAASSYVLGKESEIVGGSGTATRTNAIVSAAEQRFELPAERLREGAAKIINQHLDLLQLNIPEGLEQKILGDNGDPLFSPNELSMEGISGEFDCYLLPDPSQGDTNTERQIISMLYSVLMQNPIVMTDPVKIYQNTSKLLKAYGEEPVEWLGPEPDQDMITDPQDENTLALQGQFKLVRPMLTENHLEHIRVHQELLQSPNFIKLSQIVPELGNQVGQFMQFHIQQHMQMMQKMLQISQMGGKGGKPRANQTGIGGNPGTPGEQGMAQTQGPLGEALNRKRSGESGQPEIGKIQ